MGSQEYAVEFLVCITIEKLQLQYFKTLVFFQ